jgi:sulfite exporter TauE/SafE
MLIPILSAAFFGSWHCVGMCGGLVAVAGDGARGRRERATVQLSYQAARLGSYVVLGAVAGSLGHALDLAGRAAGLGQVAAIVAGGTMIVWGLLAMLRAAGHGPRLPELRLPAPLVVWLGRSAARPPLLRAALLGGSSALLPCGFLYGFAFAAAATASPGSGALVMAALWLGNLPALLGFGWLVSSALGRVRRHLPMLGAAGIFALGLLTVNARVNLPAFAATSVAHALGAEPMPADCPFHHGMKR